VISLQRGGMAFGKNKRLTKGKKGSKKKATDPFARKEWYRIKAPSMFGVRNAGNTLVNKTAGTKISTDGLKGRVCELNLADLQQTASDDQDQSHRKIRLIIEEIQGRDCLTHFHGMSLTRDKLCSLIRKTVSLIEANTDVKTVDGYIVRMFVIAFTNRRPEQVKTNCYAQTALIKRIRKKMVEIMQAEVTSVSFSEMVKKLIAESIGKQIIKSTQGIFPLTNCFVRKVKVIKKPKFDIIKFREVHDSAGHTGDSVLISEPVARQEEEGSEVEE